MQVVSEEPRYSHYRRGGHPRSVCTSREARLAALQALPESQPSAQLRAIQDQTRMIQDLLPRTRQPLPLLWMRLPPRPELGLPGLGLLSRTTTAAKATFPQPKK